jgi:trehalose 6-phosphate synthase/phosphatase
LKVQDLFEYYAELTPGSIVDQKEWSITWHYRAAKPYIAQKNLVAIRHLLQPIATKYGLRTKNGHKVVEVHPADFSKGKTAERWLIDGYDFVLCAGDDVTDEDMFVVMPSEAYSIKVGRGATSAHWRIESVDEMVELLGKL